MIKTACSECDSENVIRETFPLFGFERVPGYTCDDCGHSELDDPVYDASCRHCLRDTAPCCDDHKPELPDFFTDASGKTWDVVTATAPAHWASYLINGDASSFDLSYDAGHDDIALADAFQDWIGGPIVDVSQDTFFSRYCDAPGITLGGDMATYTAHVLRK